MNRSYYSYYIRDFLNHDDDLIIGKLANENEFELLINQRNAWNFQIAILKEQFRNFLDSKLLFEYTIPRRGKRIDNVLLHKNIVFIIEFKVGETSYKSNDMDQVMDYALDLKNFHKESLNRMIVPILVSTKADCIENNYDSYEDCILKVICSNGSNLEEIINDVSRKYSQPYLDYEKWEESDYMPTPTIIEAAQALYRNHTVEEISRNDAGAINLSKTTKAIYDVIEFSKKNNRKSICFITGVPGAGKTLAGINIANLTHDFENNIHSMFLSGNGPLVDVLQEALARDEVLRNGGTKKEALRKVSSFIDVIHHYRNLYFKDPSKIPEKIVIFDEAQRAWNKETISAWMSKKKKITDFNYSEPEFLIETVNRHKDWGVIICLVGGGQEINKGEAGLIEWFNSIKRGYPDWDVYLSENINDYDYTMGKELSEALEGLNVHFNSNLHLSVSLRSFKSQIVSDFVKKLLDNKKEEARALYSELKKDYPFVMTRDFNKAKSWIRNKARGTERYGIIASSGAKRLKPEGIYVNSEDDIVPYMLNDKNDVRSSYYLEECATEFGIQGLELDWAIVGWDGDFRYVNGKWSYNEFRGDKWTRPSTNERRLYLKNTYRVLLTRSRQGMIIFIPHGSDTDHTRKHEYFDGTYEYLKSLGIEEI